jgi:DNA-binding response OmpR family regulator
MKILYLEDDLDLSETVEEFLVDEGFAVSIAYNTDEALELLYSQNFDLLILDVQVPGINGFELLKQLRDANTQTPAIFTTSRNSIDDLSMGYDVGADDYIKKPFLLKELLLRIKALLKREYSSFENIIQLNNSIFIDIKLQQLIINNEKYEINHKELELLKLLIKNKNQCVNTETIFETVWGYEKTHSEQSLRTYIKNLRKFLGKELIVNIKKQGYMLVIR